MNSDPYSLKVRKLFANTAHAGDIPGGVSGFYEDQGVRLRLSASVTDGAMTALRFQAWACPHVIAAAEMVCSLFEGRPVADLELFNTAQIMDDLGIPVEKTGRILVLEDTVRSLGQAIQDRTDH
ncbi:MAG: iron-sulfur cluster assembly scaffold protein [Gammaproteobacteria bacterium]|nr:iron-sulfur cluster assembly scaffold protein [Gammaproteobacteria bacterium]